MGNGLDWIKGSGLNEDGPYAGWVLTKEEDLMFICSSRLTNRKGWRNLPFVDDFAKQWNQGEINSFQADTGMQEEFYRTEMEYIDNQLLSYAIG